MTKNMIKRGMKGKSDTKKRGKEDKVRKKIRRQKTLTIEEK